MKINIYKIIYFKIIKLVTKIYNKVYQPKIYKKEIYNLLI